ncbi:MAG: hypothetical protein AAFV88_09465 [Planctomycetota bacterium]
MRNLGTLLAVICSVALLSCPSVTAQRPGQRPGPPRGEAGGRQGQGRQGNQNAMQQNVQGFGNQNLNANGQQGIGNQQQGQNGPSVQQMAQMLLANFDADGSGELNQVELQNGLMALRQRMQNRGNQLGQGQMNQVGINDNPQRGGFGNQNQNAADRMRGNTAQGARQGNGARRGGGAARQGGAGGRRGR